VYMFYRETGKVHYQIPLDTLNFYWLDSFYLDD